MLLLSNYLKTNLANLVKMGPGLVLIIVNRVPLKNNFLKFYHLFCKRNFCSFPLEPSELEDLKVASDMSEVDMKELPILLDHVV